MNKEFANYVREASFHLSLSQAMIETLLGIDRDLNKEKRPYGLSYGRATTMGLFRRGFIVPSKHESVPKEWTSAEICSAFDLTKAGQIMCDLLKEAGFKAWELDEPYQHEEPPEVVVTLKEGVTLK